VPTGGPEPIVVGPEIVERVLVLARRTGTLRDPAVAELEYRLRAGAPQVQPLTASSPSPSNTR
jgi:hypothetical protein